MKSKKAPGKSYRKGMTVMQVMDMFPTEKSAVEWFEQTIWSNTGRYCGHCGSVNTKETPNRKPMPYWCVDCRNYFSIRTGTPLAHSKVSLRKWAVAVYLEVTSLKSVSSMKLSRDIDVTQPTAWFMLHRIREAWSEDGDRKQLEGPVEIDETFMGGLRRNMPKSKRKSLDGRGAVGKSAIVGVKDRATNEVRAKVIQTTDRDTLHGFVHENADPKATVYTDEWISYKGMARRHEVVRHSVGEYVRGQAHTNGIESFWSMLKRAHKGTFHKLSSKHLHRYVGEFAGKHNLRELDTLDQMGLVVRAMVGKSLPYRVLVDGA